MKNYIMGNEAMAMGALEAGVRMVTGYPGTPATEIVDFCLKGEQVYVEWSVNEKVALEMAMGASLCNIRSMAVMKHNGTNYATDFIMHLNFTGVKGGMVLVSADDPGAYSSQNEEDTRILIHTYAHLPLSKPEAIGIEDPMQNIVDCNSIGGKLPAS
jgi:indolepyruvate ferredoxin oxidoreductase alpha subunit